jgi:hypothetical protein
MQPPHQIDVLAEQQALSNPSPSASRRATTAALGTYQTVL